MFGKNDGRHPQQGKSSSKEVRKFLDGNPGKPAQQPLPNRAVDRSMFGNGAPVPGQAADWSMAVSEQILVYHESEPVEPGVDWMSQLKQDSLQFLADQRGVHLQEVYRESIYKSGIAILVDKIYGLLQRYMFEFNQVANGTELHVSGSISGDVTEVTKYNRFREAEETKTYFRARFSTRLCSLVVRGCDDKVECFLVPTSKVMALSRTENDYQPISTIQVKITEQGMMWRMQDANPPIETLDQLCMWLFSAMIQETKNYARLGGEEAAGAV
ncbi:MAG TPA: hypothetical protein PLC15_01855 [Candidatus Obscuribacter sp.]|nr:hypothetical protein [Candidatus Obscuribacter sp.]MBK9278190.1 hypothetical protein [Candidatus Obscuribacter sp.]MBL8081196.1 hypothetical protein [Candidatus Obscuribacter sp.]HMW92086.1 hypothetical protein [Candidatus Obscuribacter sp.]HMY03432.1 hypothetical protein [Candidatus Obscuribacter sp.]